MISNSDLERVTHATEQAILETSDSLKTYCNIIIIINNLIHCKFQGVNLTPVVLF